MPAGSALAGDSSDEEELSSGTVDVPSPAGASAIDWLIASGVLPF